MRRLAKVDSNQPDIVEAFRKLGASVMHCHTLGHGKPDLVVGLGGICICIEIKDSSKPPSKQRLTADEQEFHDNWKGGMKIVKDEQDVLDTVETLRRWHRAIWAATP